MSWFSCRRNAAIRASLRRKNTHCPTLVAVIRPARCSTARCVDTVDWDSPQRPSMWPAQTPCSKVWRAFLEIRLGILQPRQDLAAHRVGERLEDGVGVDGWSSPAEAEFEGSGFIFKYRNLSNHISLKIDICSYPRRVGILAAFARQLRLVDAMPPGSREPCALIHRPPCRAAGPRHAAPCAARAGAASGPRRPARLFRARRRAPWRSGARSPRRGSFPAAERL